MLDNVCRDIGIEVDVYTANTDKNLFKSIGIVILKTFSPINISIKMSQSEKDAKREIVVKKAPAKLPDWVIIMLTIIVIILIISVIVYFSNNLQALAVADL